MARHSSTPSNCSTTWGTCDEASASESERQDKYVVVSHKCTDILPHPIHYCETCGTPQAA
jgi:hypothetical protein